MQRDFKIGMALGLALVAIVVVLLSARPNLSIKARMRSPQSAVHREIGNPTFSHSVEPREETAISGSSAKKANNEQLKEMKVERFHIVRAGETLTEISYKYYGSAEKWQKILDANRSRLKDGNTLIPGVKLTIPQ
ncbi:MAG: LysM peptidoglycan-binding domain-containing protein [Phycisphaerae bacterium]|nr:LysM peptidoglycan-binding domain-containing protein [Phycisphaerae bacterium]MDD5381193.1 LysM peptidoglycan-binding domain-containing protein [Phycisphaerae bacterium]